MTETRSATMTMTATEPVADRPHIPGYGVPDDEQGLLPWSHVVRRLAAARNYWVVTAGPDGRPHAVPVWGAWAEGALYVGAGPRSARNLAANPQVSIHLESGDDVVIVEGAVTEITEPSPALSAALDDAFAAKYDWRPSAAGEDPVGKGMRRLDPRVAYAWTNFPQDATRWRFPAE